VRFFVTLLVESFVQVLVVFSELVVEKPVVLVVCIVPVAPVAPVELELVVLVEFVWLVEPAAASAAVAAVVVLVVVSSFFGMTRVCAHHVLVRVVQVMMLRVLELRFVERFGVCPLPFPFPFPFHFETLERLSKD
jgi:hypothetical protein